MAIEPAVRRAHTKNANSTLPVGGLHLADSDAAQMPKARRANMRWVETLTPRQLAYAARRLGIVQSGMDLTELRRAITTHDRRGMLKECDVKGMRMSFEELELSVDWSEWASAREGRVSVYSPAWVLATDTVQSRTLYLKERGYKWVGMGRRARSS